MNSVIRLVIRDIVTFNRSLLVVQLVLPLFLLFVAGIAFKSLIPPFTYDERAVAYQQFLAVGLIGLTTMNGSLLAGTLLWTDRRHAMYQQILVGPFRRTDYVMSKILSSTLLGLIGAIIIAVLSYVFVGGISLTLTGFLLATSTVVLDALFFGSLAFIIASFVNSLEVFEGIFNFLLILFTFVSSSLYPANIIPNILRYILLLNPLTYVIDILRFALLGIGSGYLLIESLLLLSETVTALALAFLAINKLTSAV